MRSSSRTHILTLFLFQRQWNSVADQMSLLITRLLLTFSKSASPANVCLRYQVHLQLHLPACVSLTLHLAGYSPLWRCLFVIYQNILFGRWWEHLRWLMQCGILVRGLRDPLAPALCLHGIWKSGSEGGLSVLTGTRYRFSTKTAVLPGGRVLENVLGVGRLIATIFRGCYWDLLDKGQICWCPTMRETAPRKF